jgi:hypothetical protein
MRLVQHPPLDEKNKGKPCVENDKGKKKNNPSKSRQMQDRNQFFMHPGFSHVV